MGGKRSKKKQVQVRSASTRSASPSLHPLPPRGEDFMEISSMAPTASPEVEDRLSPVSMKGGCGKLCRHLDRGVNIDKLSAQFGKSKCTLSVCQDCIKDSKATSGKKGKAKSAKKKLIQNSASHISKKWICLACGHVGCGSIVNKSTVEQSDVSNEEIGQDDAAPTGHAWKHSLIAKHPLALQSGDRLTCWCFMCNMAVDFYLPTDREAEDIRQLGNAPLQEAMKLVREKLMKETGTFKAGGRGVSVVEHSKPLEVVSLDGVSSESPTAQAHLTAHSLAPKRSRVVKGLINLGNTCFFNSVMQNLLALDMLRDYFTQDSQAVEGPLTSSLRRLFLDTNADCLSSKAPTDSIGYESGLKKGVKGRLCWESSVAYNPRSLFGAICAKAPRFRGFQQQDSHELLRCLLEGLNSEEQSTKPVDADNRKSSKSSGPIEASEEDDSGSPKDGGKSIPSSQSSTLVDKYFGGQLSSTVCCCECGYSSVVYEPVLDLSLQIPTRQPAKKNQARANQRSSSSLAGPLQKVSSSREMKPTKAAEKTDLTKSPLLSRPAAASENKVISLQISSSVQNAEARSLTESGGASTKVLSSVDMTSEDFGWLDFVGGGTQLAEGSLQGFEDNSGTVDGSSSVVAHAVESLWENNNRVRPSTEISYLQPTHSTERSGDSIGILPHNASDSTVNDPAVDNLNEESSLNLTMSTEDVSQSEQDGPLPLAAGILLLPYEPLQLSSKYNGEEQQLCIEADKCENKATSSLQGQEKDVPASLLEQDDGDLDGFSQLFAEEESFGEAEQGMEVKACLKSLQVPEESSVDGSWDADGAAFDGGEVASGLERSIDLQEAVLPLSLEGCLADFTKAELLSGENAWECESCTKRMKEKALTLTSGDEGKDEVPYTPLEEGAQKEGCTGLNKESCVKGGHSEMKKETCKFHCEGTVARADESLSVPSTHGNGALLHDDSSSLITRKQNGTADQACPVGKDLQNGAFSAHMASNRVAQECHATVEVKGHLNCRLGNGSARLNELDSGQVCGNQSPVEPRDVENGCVDQEGSSMLVVNNPQKKSSYMDGNDVLNVGLLKQEDGPDIDEMPNGTSMPSSNKIDAQSNPNPSGDKSLGAFSSMPKDKAASSLKTSNKQLLQGKHMKRKSQLGHQQVVKRDATKRLLISKAPPILTVHLKRFAQDMRGRLNKLSGHVTFPEMLDLRPFLDPKYLDLESCIYRLVGVVEHGGTMRGGHYVAYVRGPALEGENIDLDRDCWYYISDSSVHKSSLQAVLNSEAYLLFYEKCKFG